MFDITAIANVSLSRLAVIHHEGAKSNIILYTALGSFNGQYSNSSAWTQIASTTVSLTQWSWVPLDFDSINLEAGLTQSFYVVTSGNVIVGNDNNDPLISDERIQFRSPGRAFSFSTPFIGSSYLGYSL